MDEERSDDALSAADEALRALRAELSVAPSPDFQARVRARIAQPRAARRWGFLVPALAAAALLVVATVWMPAPRGPRIPSASAQSPAPPPPVAPAPVADPPARPSPAVPTPRRAAARGVVAPVQPLVPAGEDTRIVRYAMSVRQHPFQADTLPLSDPNQGLAEPAPIEVAPLDTMPLVPDEGSDR